MELTIEKDDGTGQIKSLELKTVYHETAEKVVQALLATGPAMAKGSNFGYNGEVYTLSERQLAWLVQLALSDKSQKIQSIKFIRELTGKTLKDAKEWVEGCKG